jgi:hypothetical protein
MGANLTDQGQLLSEGPPARMTAVSIQAARADAVPLLYEFAIEAGQIIRPTSPGVAFPADTVDARRQGQGLIPAHRFHGSVGGSSIGDASGATMTPATVHGKTCH